MRPSILSVRGLWTFVGQRYCTFCGSRMRRMPDVHGYDPVTGDARLRWWWKCVAYWYAPGKHDRMRCFGPRRRVRYRRSPTMLGMVRKA